MNEQVWWRLRFTAEARYETKLRVACLCFLIQTNGAIATVLTRSEYWVIPTFANVSRRWIGTGRPAVVRGRIRRPNGDATRQRTSSRWP